MRDRASGLDDRPVEPDREEKSISAEETFDADLRAPAEMKTQLKALADRTASRLRAHNLLAGRVSVKIRRADFTTYTRQRVLEPATQETAVVAAAAEALLCAWLASQPRAAVRLLGVGVADLQLLRQSDLFSGPLPDSGARLDSAVDGIRDRFGEGLLTRASLLPRGPGERKLRTRWYYPSRSCTPAFFGLTEKPFAITPDPRYLYLSERHAEALAHLLYGINESGGFIQLTGEVGTGKTTVVRTLLSRVPHHADVAVILNPRVTPVEFLLTICEELGLAIADADRDSIKAMVDALNRRLLKAHAEGRRIIVLVDEAQNLSIDVLEQVRLLTNLETATQKLLQIILIGQPELRELLDRTDLRQLAQRITGRYHLMPLSREETKGYVRHRLRVAGATEEIFTPGALLELHRLSLGIPRVINVACDRALLGAYTQEIKKISASLVRRAAGEVYGRRFLPTWLGWVVGSAGSGGAGRHAVPRLAVLAPPESGLECIPCDQECRNARGAARCAGSSRGRAAACPRAEARIGQCAAASQ